MDEVNGEGVGLIGMTLLVSVMLVASCASVMSLSQPSGAGGEGRGQGQGEPPPSRNISTSMILMTNTVLLNTLTT